MAEIKKIAFGLAGLGIGLVLIDKLGDSEIFNAEHAGNSSSQETVSKKGLISKLREWNKQRGLLIKQQGCMEINMIIRRLTI